MDRYVVSEPMLAILAIYADETIGDLREIAFPERGMGDNPTRGECLVELFHRGILGERTE